MKAPSANAAAKRAKTEEALLALDVRAEAEAGRVSPRGTSALNLFIKNILSISILLLGWGWGGAVDSLYFMVCVFCFVSLSFSFE